MKNSKISWTDHTANFWTGCVKVSPGCEHCYAEALSKRFGKHVWGPAKTTPRLRGIAVWQDVLKWNAEAARDGVRRRVFVSSMSDFLEDHPMVTEWREQAKALIRQLKHLDVLILTKRPENAARFLADWYDDFPDNVWMGTSVENQKSADERTLELLKIPSRIRFLSVEPMLEGVNLGLLTMNWLIAGGESGPRCRPFDWDWARDLRDQCERNGTRFWMKQGGGYPNKRHELSDIPEDLRIRELPL